MLLVVLALFAMGCSAWPIGGEAGWQIYGPAGVAGPARPAGPAGAPGLAWARPRAPGAAGRGQA